VVQTVRSAPVSAADLALDADGASRVRVIEIVPEQLLTIARELEPSVRDGVVVADPSRDLAKIAVIERHLGTGRIGHGFVRGSGLRRGALASTVAHDAHNIVVVGMDDEDMTRAVERLGELGGGIVVVDGGEVKAELPLPVAGLLADAPLAEVIDKSLACNDAAREVGWSGATPFLTLSFLGLSVIPSLKITDRGLVDVDRFQIVPLKI
jgi:adenine deaminase